MKTSWWVVLLGGIIAILTGLFLLYKPAATTNLLIQILGIYWLAQGIVSFLGAIVYKEEEHRIWKLIAGILSILAGIFLLMYPIYGTFIVLNLFVIFIAIWVIISGIMGVYSAIQGAGWGAGIIGIISIILGLLLLANFVVGVLVLPWVFGFFLILGGIAALFLGLRMRSI